MRSALLRGRLCQRQAADTIALMLTCWGNQGYQWCTLNSWQTCTMPALLAVIIHESCINWRWPGQAYNVNFSCSWICALTSQCQFYQRLGTAVCRPNVHCLLQHCCATLRSFWHLGSAGWTSHCGTLYCRASEAVCHSSILALSCPSAARAGMAAAALKL